jgi:Domain of unknown function (DUF397)
VALVGDFMLVRDSKDADGPVLCFIADSWDAFIVGANNGIFDEGSWTRSAEQRELRVALADFKSSI